MEKLKTKQQEDTLYSLAKTPCAECGSRAILPWRGGVFLRGCCREAGDNEVSIVRVTSNEYWTSK